MIGSDTTLPRLNATISLVFIDGTAHNLQVLWSTGSFRENEHAQMSLFVASPTSGTDFGIIPGQRIEFDFGVLGNTMKFQGYVADVTQHKRITNGRDINEQEISCLGPSMVFKGNRPRFFTELTCTQMIARIVADASLGFSDEFHSDNTTWRTLAQTNETDWEMLVGLAARIGAHVLIDRGVVRLLDYQDIMYRLLPTRFYTKGGTIPLPGHASLPPEGEILDFTPTNQSTIDPKYSKSSMAYLDNGQAVQLPASSSSQRFSIANFATDMPARNITEAQTIQDGLYIPDWVQSGTLRVVGDATVPPGSVVSISTSARGMNVVTADFDGVWYVKGVSHVVSPQAFTTSLDVGRIMQRVPNWRSDYPFWLGDKRGVPSLFPSGNGYWLSTWRQTT